MTWNDYFYHPFFTKNDDFDFRILFDFEKIIYEDKLSILYNAKLKNTDKKRTIKIIWEIIIFN